LPTLADYRTELRERLAASGSNQNLYADDELNRAINRARRQVALEGQCIRALTPIAGPISSISVGSAGSGYTAADIVIAGPDMPDGGPRFPTGVAAAATATLSGTTLGSVTVTSGGHGYFAPSAFVSGNGSGASVTATVSGLMATVGGQEIYPFAWARSVVQAQQSGIADIAFVGSISSFYGNVRYTLARVAMGKYQALVRSYSGGAFQYNPGIFAQFGQGSEGTVYMYPVPSQRLPMEWDVCCIPQDLNTSDTVPETIPFPWTDAVVWLAAYYAYSGKQRSADAQRAWGEFERFMKRARAMSMPFGVSSWYGRIPG
jgi:hypothetical protein